MKMLPALCRQSALVRLHLPALLLFTLLQRTPVVRLLQTTADLVTTSPLGAVLRSAVATASSLGALHSLAGATVLLASQPGPISVPVGQAITPIGFTVTDTINIGSWKIGGTFPPGLVLMAIQSTASLTGPGILDATTAGADDGYGVLTGGTFATTPLLQGTPTAPGSYTLSLQAFEKGAIGGLASRSFDYVINVAGAPATTTTPPVFSSQPAPQSVTPGATVTFTATATGTPAPTYQWQKNGTAIPTATAATLTLTNVSLTDAGTYLLTATNSAGTVPATAVTLTVTAPPTVNVAAAIARQPAAQTVATGSTVVFNVEATGLPAPTYQWHRNNTALPGATAALLVIKNASSTHTGTYTAVVTNSLGTVTSGVAALALSNDAYFGHLVNLSIRTSLTPSVPDFTVGTVIGGTNTVGNKALLARAVGPSLIPFGLTDAVIDSKIDLLSGTTVVGTNDNWNGTAAITTANAAVGAFPFASNTSKDAAIFNPATAAGSYTLQIAGVGGATGTVLAELYDATAVAAFTAATPRLINVSVRKQIDAGEILTAGFVIGGHTSRTVLIRAVGPTLGVFGVPGTMSDPKLELYFGSAVLAANDNWGGDAQLNAVCAAVGAFGISDTASKDAMLVITLAPGAYTAQVGGANNSSGAALVEIYEVP